MPNRYFNNTIDLINNTRARASDVEANFDQVEDGFDTTQAEMDLKAPLASPTFTGTVTLPNTTSIGNVSSAEIAHLDGVTSPLQTQIDTKAPSADPTFTGNATFNNVTVNGTMDVTNTVIANVSTPVANNDAANKAYVDTAVASLVSAAPGALDTLDELAAALGDDPNFATTVTNSIATKVAKAGDTMTGNLAMSGFIVTGLGAPTTGSDATNKTYVDGILGSATAAAASAAAAEAAYDSFDDRYLGPKASDPTLDNDGNALLTGALYWNSVANEMRVYSGTVWTAAYLPVGDFVTLTGVETLTNKTLTSPTINTGTASGLTLNDGYTEEIFAVTGTTPALSPTNGSVQTWTLTGASTPTAGTWANGQAITLLIDDGTAYTITWSSLAVTWKTNGGSAPTLLTSGLTVIQLWKVGDVVYGARVGDA
jgi:hypothetical protein